MNIPVKYRVWIKSIKKILPVVGFCFNDPTGDVEVEYPNKGQYRCWNSQKGECVIMQYFGKKDKKDKEIYAEDIINLINENGESINVVCEFGIARRKIFENIVDITGFYFKLPNGKKTFPIVNNYCGKHDLELFEVIGNTFENPELTKIK